MDSSDGRVLGIQSSDSQGPDGDCMGYQGRQRLKLPSLDLPKRRPKGHSLGGIVGKS